MTFAKDRDGTTEIWGTITRPTRFHLLKKYPVIENIYADPRTRTKFRRANEAHRELRDA